MSRTKLGRVQLQIMKVLWARKAATARDVTAALNEHGEIAHSTVQTLLRQLEEKGAVSHETVDRTFVFRPLIGEESVARSATRELIDRVFSGDAAGLATYLIKEEEIPPGELDALRKLIEERVQHRETPG